jgi:hypothetical protein
LSPFFFFSVLEISGLHRGRKIVFFFLISLTLIFIGLRYNTGWDYTAYIYRFEQAKFSKDIFKDFSTEPGFVLLNAFIKIFSNNYYILQFFVTFFVCLAVYKYVVRYSDYPLVSFSFFIYSVYLSVLMGQIRQSIAMAIVLMSIKFIFEKKPFVFALMILSASMFHITAVCFFPLYLLNRKYNRVIAVIAVLFSPLLYYGGAIIANFISSLAPYMPNRLLSITIKYFTNSIYVGKSEFNTGIYYIFRIFLTLFLLIAVKVKNKRMHFFLNALVVSMLVRAIATGFFIFNRFVSYFCLFDAIAYTYLFELINFRKLKDCFLLYAFCILLFFILPSIKTVTVDKNKTSLESGVGGLDTFIPYYNLLYYPPEADLRR